MPSDHTRSAILAAAERLYADRGFGDVTLRDIVAEANVNLAAVNYHFGSKDELIAELYVTRSIQTNRERLNELKAAEENGGGRAAIDEILRALVGPPLRDCLGRDREGSTAARFMIRASIESVRRSVVSRTVRSIICASLPARCAAHCPIATRSNSTGACILRWQCRTTPSARRSGWRSCRTGTATSMTSMVSSTAWCRRR